MITAYPDNLSLHDARDLYFRNNGFGADGGYDAAWVELQVVGIPTPFPNSTGRKRAVRFHDLHHIATGYGTDWRGEAEISAWEIGAGCEREIVPWQLNLSMIFVGLLIAPRRTFRAFVRGRRGRSFYGERYEDLMPLTVGEARERLGTSQPPSPGRAADFGLFALSAAGGMVAGALSLLIFIPLMPLGILAGVLAKRRAARTAT